MRVLQRLLSVALLAGAATLYMNCGGSDPKPKSNFEIQFEKLTPPTWVLQSVVRDTEDMSADFQSVTLDLGGTFNDNNASAAYTYTFTGTFPDLSPWPKSGTWRFGSDPNTQLVRLDDSQNMSYTVTDTQLTISFTYAGEGFIGGRVNIVEGNWTFTFNKQ